MTTASKRPPARSGAKATSARHAAASAKPEHARSSSEMHKSRSKPKAKRRPVPKYSLRCEACGQEFRGRAGRLYCLGCSKLSAARRRSKYPITVEVKALLQARYDTRIPGRVAEIAAQLGWPAWMVKRAARLLGLTHPAPAGRRNWTLAEVAVLEKWQGLRSAKWIAERLARTETSVIVKMKRLGLSRRVRNGYSLGDVAKLFGVDIHTVSRWVKLGYLTVKAQGTARRRDIRRASREALLAFLADHRHEYRLDKVEQGALLELLFGPEEEPSGKRLGELLEYRPGKSARELKAEFALAAARREGAPAPGEIARRKAALRESHLEARRRAGSPAACASA